MAREYIRATRVIGNIKQFGGILLFDDASNGMQWKVSGNAANPRCIVDISGALSGGAILRAYNDSETITDAKTVVITKYFPTCNSDVYTSKLFFKMDEGDNTKFIVLTLHIDDGANYFECGIKLYLAEGKLQYLNHEGSYTDIVEDGFALSTDAWNYIEFGFNKVTGKYSKLILNDVEYDISDKDVFGDGGSGASAGYFEIVSSQAGTVASAELWLDSILITGD